MSNHTQMFGCTLEDLEAVVAEKAQRSSYKMIAMSWLSDAQELHDLGQKVAANWNINKAKFVISQYLKDEAQ